LLSLLGLGTSYPDQTYSNTECISWVPTSDQPEGFSSTWISDRTGIFSRRLVSPWGAPLDSKLAEAELQLSIQAASRALKQAQVSAQELKAIVTLRSVARPELPSLSQKLITALESGPQPTLDLIQASTGVPLAFDLIQKSNWADEGPVLLVVPEILSPYLSPSDPSTAVLFGDAAAACVLQSNAAGLYRVIKTSFESSGDPKGVLKLDRYFSMKGKELFRYAIPSLVSSGKAVLENEHAHWYLPHQANRRIMNRAAKSLGYEEPQILSSIESFGNTSSASTLLTLALEQGKKKFHTGQKLLINTCGSGLSHGSALLEVTQ
jgi:3-oxoacyl-[acyl-carrier-protein] synthase III